ncbi:hypothetical protein NADFUDRAFT_67480, partial [Nadsonia fulvescens var. elongata DSM 6958]
MTPSENRHTLDFTTSVHHPQPGSQLPSSTGPSVTPIRSPERLNSHPIISPNSGADTALVNSSPNLLTPTSRENIPDQSLKPDLSSSHIPQASTEFSPNTTPHEPIDKMQFDFEDPILIKARQDIIASSYGTLSKAFTNARIARLQSMVSCLKRDESIPLLESLIQKATEPFSLKRQQIKSQLYHQHRSIRKVTKGEVENTWLKFYNNRNTLKDKLLSKVSHKIIQLNQEFASSNTFSSNGLSDIDPSNVASVKDFIVRNALAAKKLTTTSPPQELGSNEIDDDISQIRSGLIKAKERDINHMIHTFNDRNDMANNKTNKDKNNRNDINNNTNSSTDDEHEHQVSNYSNLDNNHNLENDDDMHDLVHDAGFDDLLENEAEHLPLPPIKHISGGVGFIAKPFYENEWENYQAMVMVQQSVDYSMKLPITNEESSESVDIKSETGGSTIASTPNPIPQFTPTSRSQTPSPALIGSEILLNMAAGLYTKIASNELYDWSGIIYNTTGYPFNNSEVENVAFNLMSLAAGDHERNSNEENSLGQVPASIETIKLNKPAFGDANLLEEFASRQTDASTTGIILTGEAINRSKPNSMLPPLVKREPEELPSLKSAMKLNEPSVSGLMEIRPFNLKSENNSPNSEYLDPSQQINTLEQQPREFTEQNRQNQENQHNHSHHLQQLQLPELIEHNNILQHHDQQLQQHQQVYHHHQSHEQQKQ